MATRNSVKKSSVRDDENSNHVGTSQIKQMTNSSPIKNDEKVINNNDDMDFDELLPYVGEFGFYQRMLFLFMIPFSFFVAFVYFGQIFITFVPVNHWCRVPELENLTVEQR